MREKEYGIWQSLSWSALATLVLAFCLVSGGQYQPTRPWVVPPIPGASTFTEWHGYHYDAAHSGYNPNIPAAGALSRARELEALGFLQITLAAGEKVSWAGGFGVAADGQCQSIETGC